MSTARPWSHAKAAAAVALLLFVVYQVNLRQISPDTVASRLVPIALLEYGHLHLDEFGLAPPGESLPHYVVRARGHVYDAYPPVAPLAALPLYALPVWLDMPSDPILLGNIVSKLAASAMAAGSAGLLWMALVSFGHSRRTAWLVSIAYGLGTSIWSTASQGLWTHSPAVFAFALALVLERRGAPASSLAAVAIGGIARPVMLLTLPVWLYAVIGSPRDRGAHATTASWLGCAARTSLPAAALVLAGFAYNLWLSGSVVGGAEQRNVNWTQAFGAAGMWDGNLVEGAIGLLASPSRGILIYTPIALLAAAGAWRVWRRPSTPALARDLRVARCASVACVIAYLAYSKYLVWWGGHAYGPRYLTDVLPFACLLMAVGWERPRTWEMSQPPARKARAAGAWLVLGVYSIAVQAIGAFCWPSDREGTIDMAYYQNLWSWRQAQIISCLESGPRFDPVGRRVLERLGIDVGPE